MSDVKYPSKSNENPRRKSVGSWISKQRQVYKNGELSEERIRKLEQLYGWSWTPLLDQVNKKKQQLLEMAQAREPRPNKRKFQLGVNTYLRNKLLTIQNLNDKSEN